MSKTSSELRVTRNVYDRLRQELRLLPVYREALEELVRDYQDQLHRSRQVFEAGPSPTGTPGDPVGRTALRLAEIEQRIAAKQAQIRKVERSLAVLDPEELRVVEYRFQRFPEMLTDSLICRLRMSRNRYFTLQNRALYKMAMVFGLVE